MVTGNDVICPKCGGLLKHYSKTNRIVRKERGIKEWVQIPILHCKLCNSYHRALPENLLQYKQYEAHIIYGVVTGIITPFDLEFEDYPCEETMRIWIREFRMTFS